MKPLDLPVETLRHIRTLARSTEPCPKCGQPIMQSHIAREFKISPTAVNQIKKGRYDDIIDGLRKPNQRRPRG